MALIFHPPGLTVSFNGVMFLCLFSLLEQHPKVFLPDKLGGFDYIDLTLFRLSYSDL